MKIWSSARADKEFSKWIRARDKKCFFCNNTGTQNSHYWGRRHSATRYDPKNCDAICGGCHMRHEGDKHGLYTEKKRAQLGEKEYALLTRRANSIMKRRDAIIACMDFLTTQQ